MFELEFDNQYDQPELSLEKLEKLEKIKHDLQMAAEDAIGLQCYYRIKSIKIIEEDE